MNRYFRQLQSLFNNARDWVDALPIWPTTAVYIGLIIIYMVLPDWIDILRQIVEKFALVALFILYYKLISWLLSYIEQEFGAPEWVEQPLDQNVDANWAEQAQHRRYE